MVETSGIVITLKHPYHATSFLPANVGQRVSELQKQTKDVYGKSGFWEEFEVSHYHRSTKCSRYLIFVKVPLKMFC